jgi:lysine-specific histone demethylase 1
VLRPNDVLTALNGEVVSGQWLETLVRTLGGYCNGQRLAVRVLRGGQTNLGDLQSPRCRVIGRQGGEQQEIWCDAVVVTVPLGVLKEGSIRFSPSLPSRKLLAIHKLGYGRLEKLVLRFSTNFWGASVTNGAPFIGRLSDELREEDPLTFFWFVDMSRVTGSPVLVAFLPAKV